MPGFLSTAFVLEEICFLLLATSLSNRSLSRSERIVPCDLAWETSLSSLYKAESGVLIVFFFWRTPIFLKTFFIGTRITFFKNYFLNLVLSAGLRALTKESLLIALSVGCVFQNFQIGSFAQGLELDLGTLAFLNFDNILFNIINY